MNCGRWLLRPRAGDLTRGWRGTGRNGVAISESRQPGFAEVKVVAGVHIIQELLEGSVKIFNSIITALLSQFSEKTPTRALSN